MMRRSALALSLSVAACAFALLDARDASACGGCFHEPPPPTQKASDITDERMLLSVSTQQTTLYDQIRYSGTPGAFAWVLPIHGTVDVGLSADVLFDSVDAVTATTIQAPATNCAPPPNCTSFNASSNSFAAGAEDTNGGSAVTVTKQENVGPYATVQLHSTDQGALESWLTQNGFVIPDDVKPIIAQYVAEGFDFLAMKLLPNQGVQAMRPVRVTSPGANLSLPLRMAAIGTGQTVGITVWVVSDGRYEPQNFPSFHIEDKDLVWDFSTQQSNYTTLRAQNEAQLNGKGWEIESSLSVSQSLLTNVILSGGQYYGNGNAGYPNGSTGSTSTQNDDYLPVTTSTGDGGTSGGGSTSDGGADEGGQGQGQGNGSVTQTANQVRDDDIAHLFAGIGGPNVRVTRMRSDIAHAAMTADFVLQASQDQSELSNNRVVTQSVNLTCPQYKGCGVLGSCDQAPLPNGAGSAGALAGLLAILGLASARMLRRRTAKTPK